MLRHHPSIPLALLLALVTGCHHPAATTRTVMVAQDEPPGDPSTPVARVNGETITQGELTKRVSDNVKRARNDYLASVQSIKLDALRSLIIERVLKNNADAAKLSIADYVKREVLDKLPAPTDEQLKEVYDEAVAAGQNLPPMVEITDQLRGYVADRQKEEALNAFGQKLLEGAKVERLLPPLLLAPVKLGDNGPARGPSDAPVTVVEFADYQCPFCRKAEALTEQLLTDYEGKIRLVFRQFPLPSHERAEKAAEAALCADDQGKFWEMHSRMFANQDKLSVDEIKEYAAAVGLDREKFDACLDSGKKAQSVAESRKDGEAAGVSGTPSFFVNGHLAPIAGDYEELKAIIDWALTHR